MKYRMSCEKCGAPIFQCYTVLNESQVLLKTVCRNKHCKHVSAIVIPKAMLLETPHLARKLEISKILIVL